MYNPNRTIIIVPYNAQWKTEFEKIRAMLLPYISDIIIGIEHIGSTSVEGLAAKPIIDFNIIIDSYAVFPELVERLQALGYHHEGDLGIKEREAFKRNFKDEFMEYHMYVCPKNSCEHARHIAFRDYLRKHKKAVDEYSELKTQLARKYPHDIDLYIEGKHDFIEDILLRAAEENQIKKVHFADLSDIPAWLELVEFVKDSFPGLDINEYTQILKKNINRKTALATKYNNFITGILLFSPNQSCLSFMAVHPDFRGKGIGTALFSRMVELLPSDRDISVTTYRKNDSNGAAARALYKKCGFIEDEEFFEFDYPVQKMILKHN